MALWFAARPYRSTPWKPACISALLAAGIALVANQAMAELWARPRPFVTHASATHLLAAGSPDTSFPSDHAAAAFAIGRSRVRAQEQTGNAQPVAEAA